MTKYGYRKVRESRMDSSYKDILIALYQQNETYHDVKEKVIWLAGTVYYAFSFFVIKALLDIPNDRFVDKSLCWPAAIFLVAIFVLVIWFLRFHNRAKLKSVHEFDNLRSIIKQHGAEYRKLIPPPRERRCTSIQTLTPLGRSRRYMRHGPRIPGVIVMIGASVFFVAQLTFLFYRFYSV